MKQPRTEAQIERRRMALAPFPVVRVHPGMTWRGLLISRKLWNEVQGRAVPGRPDLSYYDSRL